MGVLFARRGTASGSQWEWVDEQAGVLGAGLAGVVALFALIYALIHYIRATVALVRVPVGR